jgi:hypothetical protein
MLPEVTSDWIFYDLSGLFVAYLLFIFLTKSKRLRQREELSKNNSGIDL